jgi:superfamily II DNA or RNA helicase
VELTDLVRGTQVVGLRADGPVTVLAADHAGDEACTITFRAADGSVAEVMLFAEDAVSLSLAKQDVGFDADGELFRLAAEASRIRDAAQFDSMLAVSTSRVEPLPHQIRAVYGELLLRTPLRFLLADDPGAGKTIMAGLYIKELKLRGDLKRCLVVVPGGLVEQWQDELLDKFGLSFEILTRDMVNTTIDGTVFDQHPLLLVKMDQVARDDDLMADLLRSRWDLAIVDEAHRMSAHYYGSELKRTKRFDLGKVLSGIARHLLLMTATPHAGSEEDFEAFLTLLDADRFAGQYREGHHRVNTDGVMRRMVKEELLTFDGRPLFPERRAYTVPYELSADEQALYDAVTDYVRHEMGRADALKRRGQGRRGNTIGFALTVLQRRLASSPEAIWRSIQRRIHRLQRHRADLINGMVREPATPDVDVDSLDHDDYDEFSGAELERIEEEVLDAATAAATAEELTAEIDTLTRLESMARRVRNLGTDVKWAELSNLLTGHAQIVDATGQPSKIIIFTEHKDTLNYLTERIRTLIGDVAAVVTIHGGIDRKTRRNVQERFTTDKTVRVMVATDAAGEGLNLQRAHLMVNYDLPWNPNRIEQRFGRIHRIGQTEVCHLWNLVAEGTREGEVFLRLLDKMEEMRRAYGGKVFDVLGKTFTERPLRELLIEAIQYGDQPEVKARLQRVIDSSVSEGLQELLAERALAHEVLAPAELEEIRRRMHDAQARRLQPRYVQQFFTKALSRIGGRVVARKHGRFEVTSVPASLVERRPGSAITPGVQPRYERITFEVEVEPVEGEARAQLMAPGHPLMDAVIDEVLSRYGALLDQGTVLLDRSDGGTVPRVMVAVRQQITDGLGAVVSRRASYAEFAEGREPAIGLVAPYVDYEPLSDDERLAVIAHLGRLPDVAAVRAEALRWAATAAGEHLREVRANVERDVEKTRRLVRERLLAESNRWYSEATAAAEAEAHGSKRKLSSEFCRRQAEQMDARREARMAELDKELMLRVVPPRITSMGLIVPVGLLNQATGGEHELPFALETEEVERRAVDLVLRCERELGREPTEMARNNRGFDIRSMCSDGGFIDIEVKGRRVGADSFMVTKSERIHGANLGRRSRLALVAVHPDGPEHDDVRYLVDPFSSMDMGNFDDTAILPKWQPHWDRGEPPQ